MMNARRIATREPGHRFNAFPIGDRDELGLAVAIFTQRLHAHRLFDQRLDTEFVVVGFVSVGDLASRAAAPDSRDCGTSGWSGHVFPRSGGARIKEVSGPGESAT